MNLFIRYTTHLTPGALVPSEQSTDIAQSNKNEQATHWSTHTPTSNGLLLSPTGNSGVLELSWSRRTTTAANPSLQTAYLQAPCESLQETNPENFTRTLSLHWNPSDNTWKLQEHHTPPKGNYRLVSTWWSVKPALEKRLKLWLYVSLKIFPCAASSLPEAKTLHSNIPRIQELRLF